MLIYLLLIFTVYFGFLVLCLWGWGKYKHRKNSEAGKATGLVTVVVAVRNEAQAIASLLGALRAQDFPKDRFEVIFADDHSADLTPQYISDWFKDNPDIRGRYIKSGGEGKKQALTDGIRVANGEYILITDADCVPSADWISGMMLSFHRNTTMVIGLVSIRQEGDLFSSMQSIEFSSLQGSGIAFQALGFPVMCNGASLAFRKNSFEEVNGFEDNLHIPSGDDEFLMRKLVKRFPGSIQSIRIPSVVMTHPQKSLKSLMDQRLRWAGKWKYNDSIIARGLAVFILLFQITSLFAWIFLFSGNYFAESAALLGAKCLLEGIFLFTVSAHLHQRFSLPAFMLLQVVYPFYVIGIGFLSQMVGYEWKGRYKDQ